MGLEARLRFSDGDVAKLIDLMQAWRDVGATHLSVNTMGRDFTTLEEHLTALEQFAGQAGVKNGKV